MLPTSVRRSLGYISDMHGSIGLGLFCAALTGAVTTCNAKIVEILIDEVFAKQNVNWLYLCVYMILGIHLSKGILLFGSRYLLQRIGHTASVRLRHDLFAHIQRLSLAYFHQNRTGQIISRMTTDVRVLQDLMAIMARSVVDSFQVVFGVALMFWIQWKLAAVTFVLLPLLSIAVRKFSQRLRAIGSLLQTRIGDIASMTHETVQGIREVQSFGMEAHNAKRFKLLNDDNFAINMKETKYNALSQPVVELFHALGIGFVIWYGSVFVIKKVITPGQLMEFLACLGMIFHPIKTLTDVSNFVAKSAAAADRIFELLDEPAEIRSKPGAPNLETCRGSVRFEDASFYYEDPARPVVRELNLEVEPGEVVALVGLSGAGKTTVVHLLPRFYDVRSGRVLLDGHDLRDLDLASLRSHFAMVPQETVLFAETVAENIRYGKPGATIEELREAARGANALNFIEKMPQGFETVLGEHGVKLSGGERQRVAIARAMLKDPRILILDEATSSLDSESEKAVQEALERLMKGRTTFVIAHRLSTIKHANKIVVLDQGRILEVGTHQELWAAKGAYYRLSRTQFGLADEPARVAELPLKLVPDASLDAVSPVGDFQGAPIAAPAGKS